MEEEEHFAGVLVPVLQKAVDSVNNCKQLALLVNRFLFSFGVDGAGDGIVFDTQSAEDARAAMLQLGNEIETTESRLIASLAEDKRLRAELGDLDAANAAAQEHLAETRAEIDWLRQELEYAEEQLGAASDRLYLQVSARDCTRSYAHKA